MPLLQGILRALLGHWKELLRGVVSMLGSKDCCTGGALCSSNSVLELLRGQLQLKKRTARVKVVTAVNVNEQGGVSRERSAAVRSGKGARERRLQKVAEERKRKQNEEDGKYPEWATILENATKDDVELREIIGDAIGNPEEMRRRVEERVRRKGRDVLQTKTGSATPMVVSFRDFDSTDDHIWMEFYGPPTDKDIELIGSVFRSFFVLGRLGGFNSMNMQLTKLPLNAPLNYSTEKAKEALDAFFHNIGDVEFQDNWARLWVDLGTSDPVCLDVLINAMTNVSSDHVGIKQLVFGGKRLGDWDEDLTSDQPDFKSYKI